MSYGRLGTPVTTSLMRARVGLLAILALLLCTSAVRARADTDAWVLVETQSRTLTIFNAGRPVERFENISVGRRGAAFKRQRGDELTPLGEFHVAWVNWRSPYHIFVGLDYPNVEYAERAVEQGLIDIETYRDIRRAARNGRIPPQNTPLGGNIGIHGIGRGSPAVHEAFNWTEGCVALTNREIERLVRRVQIGTRVVIR